MIDTPTSERTIGHGADAVLDLIAGPAALEGPELGGSEKSGANMLVRVNTEVRTHPARSICRKTASSVRLERPPTASTGEFGEALPRHMRDIALILDDKSIKGPFCIAIAVRGLRTSEGMRWAFPSGGTIAMSRGIVAERVDAPSVAQRFVTLVRRASVHE